MHSLRTRFAFLLLLLTTGLLAGCGGDLSSSEVASVEGAKSNITKSEVEHWMQVSVKANSQPAALAKLDPDLKQCAADLTKQPAANGSATKPSSAELEKQCKQLAGNVRDQATALLVQGQWVQIEAAKQGIKISDKEVAKLFAKQKSENFPKAEDYQTFLTQSGMTEKDVLFRVKLDELSTRIQSKNIKSDLKPTNKQLRDYYKKNRKLFYKPQSRDIKVIATETKAESRQAKNELLAGKSFASVAQKYSLDQQTKADGGVLKGIAKGDQEASLDKVLFAAKKGKLTGPVKTSFGWFLIEVDKTYPAKQQTYAESKVAIRAQLINQDRTSQTQDYSESFIKRYTKLTQCDEDFLISFCANYKAPKTDQTKTSSQPEAQGTTPATSPKVGK